MPLTIYSLPAPFDERRGQAQRNAIRSWAKLGANILLFGYEPGVAEIAGEVGGSVHRVERARELPRQLPFVDDAVKQAEAIGGDVLCYVCTDIVILPGFLDALERTAAELDRFLLSAQRWNLELDREIDFSDGWDVQLAKEAAQAGSLHHGTACDVFCYRGIEYGDTMPPFLVSCGRLDNWFIWQTLEKRVPFVNATGLGPLVIHQNHGKTPGRRSILERAMWDRNLVLFLRRTRVGVGKYGSYGFSRACYNVTEDGLCLTGYGNRRRVKLGLEGIRCS